MSAPTDSGACRVLLWWSFGSLAAYSTSVGASSHTHRLANPFYQLGITVGDHSLGNHTYLSELYLNQNHFRKSAGFGWTANLLRNYSQAGLANRGRLSGTALVTVAPDGCSQQWHAPMGGSVTVATMPNGSVVATVSGIALGTAASETWVISINGPSLTWVVTRVYVAAVNVT